MILFKRIAKKQTKEVFVMIKSMKKMINHPSVKILNIKLLCKKAGTCFVQQIRIFYSSYSSEFYVMTFFDFSSISYDVLNKLVNNLFKKLNLEFSEATAENYTKATNVFVKMLKFNAFEQYRKFISSLFANNFFSIDECVKILKSSKELKKELIYSGSIKDSMANDQKEILTSMVTDYFDELVKHAKDYTDILWMIKLVHDISVLKKRANESFEHKKNEEASNYIDTILLEKGYDGLNARKDIKHAIAYLSRIYNGLANMESIYYKLSQSIPELIIQQKVMVDLLFEQFGNKFKQVDPFYVLYVSFGIKNLLLEGKYDVQKFPYGFKIHETYGLPFHQLDATPVIPAQGVGKIKNLSKFYINNLKNWSTSRHKQTINEKNQSFLKSLSLYRFPSVKEVHYLCTEVFFKMAKNLCRMKFFEQHFFTMLRKYSKNTFANCYFYLEFAKCITEYKDKMYVIKINTSFYNPSQLEQDLFDFRLLQTKWLELELKYVKNRLKTFSELLIYHDDRNPFINNIQKKYLDTNNIQEKCIDTNNYLDDELKERLLTLINRSKKVLTSLKKSVVLSSQLELSFLEQELYSNKEIELILKFLNHIILKFPKPLKNIELQKDFLKEKDKNSMLTFYLSWKRSLHDMKNPVCKLSEKLVLDIASFVNPKLTLKPRLENLEKPKPKQNEFIVTQHTKKEIDQIFKFFKKSYEKQFNNAEKENVREVLTKGKLVVQNLKELFLRKKCDKSYSSLNYFMKEIYNDKIREIEDKAKKFKWNKYK